MEVRGCSSAASPPSSPTVIIARRFSKKMTVTDASKALVCLHYLHLKLPHREQVER
jgi:hypothetical protein